MADVDEELQQLDIKLKQLKLAYDQYFLGTRPREPAMERREVDKLVVLLTNTQVTNTGQRFKLNSLCSRYNAFRRQWNETLRRIEQGTYQRHVFKARLHDQDPRQPAKPPASSREGAPSESAALYEAYVEARRACGQDCSGLSPQKLRAVLAQQEQALREKTRGGEVRFRVVVEDGKAKIRASRS